MASRRKMGPADGVPVFEKKCAQIRAQGHQQFAQGGQRGRDAERFDAGHVTGRHAGLMGKLAHGKTAALAQVAQAAGGMGRIVGGPPARLRAPPGLI